MLASVSKSNFLFQMFISMFSQKIKDYYRILGVDKSAKLSEIKKAYFTLAKKYHPDINKEPNAKEKFTEISEAYDTLSDEQKRRAYDESGYRSTKPFTNYNYYYDNFNSNFFKEFSDLFSSGFGTFNSNETNESRDIMVSLSISFHEAINGCNKTISYIKTSKCTECNGTKCKKGTSPQRCQTCKGSGVLRFRRMFINYTMTCEHCGGTGEIITNKCTQCHGEGATTSISSEIISIPKGIEDGVTLRIKNKGNYSPYGKREGDLYVNVNVKEDEYYRRNGYDIYTDYDVPVSIAVLGGEIEVKTLYGIKTIKIEPGVREGMYIDIGEYGVQKKYRRRGRHYVRLRVKLPSLKEMRQKEINAFKIINEFAKEKSKIKH